MLMKILKWTLNIMLVTSASFVTGMVNLMKLLSAYDIPEISDLHWHILKNRNKNVCWEIK